MHLLELSYACRAQHIEVFGGAMSVFFDCRDRKFTATLSASQANEMKHGNFGPIFKAYGLEPGVIGSIDVYALSVDFL